MKNKAIYKGILVIILTGALIAASATTPKPVSAVTFTVTNLADDSTIEGSLRWAIDQVNLLPSGTILFDKQLAGQTIELDKNNGPLVISSKIAIDGFGLRHDRVTISGEKEVQVFEITADGSAYFNHLIIANGFSDYAGGGILIRDGH